MGFSKQECWSGLPFPSPGDILDPGIEPGSPALQVDALPSQVINAKKQRKTIERERLEISSRKLEIPREHFRQRWAQLRTEMVWT